LSDIAGQDIQSHGNQVDRLITIVRNWLTQHDRNGLLPGYQPIIADFDRFARKFPDICEKAGITTRDIQYNDFVNIAKGWIAEKARV
jgi:hypothetical protein